MKIFRLAAEDGHTIRGLYSETINKKIIIIHFHGFGGDCFANYFLQVMHEGFPTAGIAFLSVNTRYSGYLVEDYSEEGVKYSGASVCNYNDIENDIGTLLSYFESIYEICILQGHSFGTNLVKLYLRKQKRDISAIFLSPADSIGLYNAWRNGKDIGKKESSNSIEYNIRMDNFGMITDYGEYQIPMTDDALNNLLDSEVFNEWSYPIKKIENKSLVVIGKEDRISNYGTTLKCLDELLPYSKKMYLDNARHIFAGKEIDLFNYIVEWICKQTGYCINRENNNERAY